MAEAPTLIEFATDVLAMPLSAHQETLLRAIAKMPLEGEQQEIWNKATERGLYKPQHWREILLLCGVRSGKDDRIATTVAVYEALFNKPKVSPGETPWVAIMAQDKKAARIAFNYTEAKLQRVAKYYGRQPIKRVNRSPHEREIELVNGAAIGVWPCNVKAIRGSTVFVGIADEIAFWWDADRYANPAEEVLKSLRTRMATITNPMLLMLTTPWSKSGIVWDMYRRRHEMKSRLVFHAITQDMNPSIPQETIDFEREDDPENFRREYLAEFTDAIRGFITWADLAPCIHGEGNPYQPGTRYVAAMDPSSRKEDTWTLGIAHQDGETAVIDRLAGWGKDTAHSMGSEEVMDEACELLKQYHVSEVVSDQYGFAFLQQPAKRRGIRLTEYTFSQTSKAKIYTDLKSRILSGKYQMPDHKAGVGELLSLEEKHTPGGGRKFEAPTGGHDDYADVCALAVHQLGAPGEFRIRRL